MNPVEACQARYREWSQPRPHPVTGDLLSPGERVTWFIMGIYRRWSVFFALQVLTVLWLAFPRYFPGGQFGWNLTWSDLAVVVEMMVGISFIGQSLRDARVIRDSLAQSHETDKVLREELAQVKADAQLIREIHEALCPGGDTAMLVVPTADGPRRLEIRDTR